jgi:hypothetical protein
MGHAARTRRSDTPLGHAARTHSVFVVLDAEVLEAAVVLLADAVNRKFITRPVLDVCCVASIVHGFVLSLAEIDRADERV